MKNITSVFFCILTFASIAQIPDIASISNTYGNAVNNWMNSSKLAYPYFDKLYFEIQPLYNTYYTNTFEPDERTRKELHKVSRNYIRFMYEYTRKFGDPKGLDNGWKLSQAIKGYESFKLYNSMLFKKKYSNHTSLHQKIKTTNIYKFNELEKLNNYVEAMIPNNNLFLESPSIQDVQNQLRPQEVYLSFSFSLNERSFFILRLTHDSRKLITSDSKTGTSSDLITRVAMLKGLFEEDQELMQFAYINLELTKSKRNSVKIDTTINSILQFLEREVIDKLNIQPNEKIIIENDIFAAQIPFDLLKNQNTGKYLIQDNDISYVSSAEHFLRLRKLREQYIYDEIIGVSPVISKGELEIENEIKLINNIFTSATIKTNTTKNNFIDLLGISNIYNVFHLSSHFRKEKSKELDNGLPDYRRQRYYFEFGEEQLYPNEILDKNTSITDLLILSGCETAVSDDVLKIIYPREIRDNTIMFEGCYCNSAESFSNLNLMSLSFQAKYTIALQNAIQPESSEQFFRQFYDYLAEYKDVRIAFRKAKLEFLNRIPDGHYDHFLIILISD